MTVGCIEALTPNSRDTYGGLETREQIDQKRMPHRIGDLEYLFFRHQALDFFAGDDFTLLQCFDREVIL